MLFILAESAPSLSLGPIVMGLLGGLALFLFGIELMSEALKKAAGDGMRQILAKRLTAGEPNRLIAFRLESEIIEYLKRIFYFAKRVAKLAAEDAPAPQRTHSETAGD